MIKKVAFTMFAVEDSARARAFYEDTLGFSRGSADKAGVWTEYDLPGGGWVTLIDGTGKAPDDRIVATSQETPSIGEVVTVQGVMKTNVNLGSGYQYKALIEDAKFTK